MTIYALKRRKEAMARLHALHDHLASGMAIHYSCEGFYNRPTDKTPRITSIALRNMESVQTETFSIHKIAEQEHIPPEEIDKNYDKLEKLMLNEYFEYLKSQKHCSFVHWNMRDINYGFAALEHRFKVLGGEPFILPNDKKIDLSHSLYEIYGKGYIGHPRFAELMKLNGISQRDFLNGEEEAEAFEKKDYVKLHRSTLVKAQAIENIFFRTVDGSLKTNKSWLARNIGSPEAIVSAIREHWFFGVLAVIAVIFSLARFVFNVF